MLNYASSILPTQKRRGFCKEGRPQSKKGKGFDDDKQKEACRKDLM